MKLTQACFWLLRITVPAGLTEGTLEHKGTPNCLPQLQINFHDNDIGRLPSLTLS